MELLQDTNVVAVLMERLRGYAQAAIGASPRIAAALIVVLVTWLIARAAGWVVRTATRRVRMRTALTDVLVMLTATAVWISGGLIALTIAFPSVTPANALTALGLGSVALGFAFKDVFENFLAGILILFREPFKLGDHIECNEIEGAVERITVRDSHLRMTDGQLVVLPNAYIFKNPVTVRTSGQFRRAKIIVRVAYGDDADRAREIILSAVRQVDTVRNDVRDVQVFAHALGSSSVDFEIAWWTGSLPVNIRESRDEVVRAVKRALDKHGITIPFPQRTLSYLEPEDPND